MIPVSSFPSADTITFASQLFVSFCFLRLSSPVRLCRAIMSISYPILSDFRMQKIIRDSTENNGLFTHPILSQNATKHGKSVAYPAQSQLNVSLRIWISSLSACLKMIEKLRLVNVARFSVSMAGFSPYTASETKSPIPLADILHENLPHFALISP